MPRTTARTIVVIGATRGLGLHAAHALLRTPDVHLVITARDRDGGDRARARLIAVAGVEPSRVTVLPLELRSLAGIRSFVAALVAERSLPPLSGLVLNAGIQNVSAMRLSNDGFEETFAVNHLAHFLLAILLAPRLVDDGRIVFVSSGTHDPERKTGMPPARFAEPAVLAAGGGFEDAQDVATAGKRRYTTSKLLNVLCAYELARRLAGLGGVTVNAFDPGAVPGTGLARDWPLAMRWVWNGMVRAMVPLLRAFGLPFTSPSRAGAQLAATVVDARWAGVTGAYIEQGEQGRSSVASYDTEHARVLWEASLRLAGVAPHEAERVAGRFDDDTRICVTP